MGHTLLALLTVLKPVSSLGKVESTTRCSKKDHRQGIYPGSYPSKTLLLHLLWFIMGKTPHMSMLQYEDFCYREDDKMSDDLDLSLALPYKRGWGLGLQAFLTNLEPQTVERSLACTPRWRNFQKTDLPRGEGLLPRPGLLGPKAGPCTGLPANGPPPV